MAYNFTLVTSDADAAIHLSKAGQFDLLRQLFTKVLIPGYIFEKEIKPKGKKVLAPIWEAKKQGWLFIVHPEEMDKPQRKIYNSALSDARAAMDDLGEAHGMALAQATGAPFFVTNDTKPYGPHDVIYRRRTLDMAARPLSHQDILFLAKSVGKLSIEECQDIHTNVRKANGLGRMSTDIKACMNDSFQKLKDEAWLVEFLEYHQASQAIIRKIKNYQQYEQDLISSNETT